MKALLASMMGLMVFGLLLQFWIHFNANIEQIHAVVDRQTRLLTAHQLIARHIATPCPHGQVRVIESSRRPGFVQGATSDVILFKGCSKGVLMALFVANTTRRTSDGKVIRALYRKLLGGVQQELVPGVNGMHIMAIRHSQGKVKLNQYIMAVQVCDLGLKHGKCNDFSFPLLAQHDD